jgi:putative transposase
MSTTGSKKNITKFPASERQKLLDTEEKRLSIRRQCELLSVNRSNFYYIPQPRVLMTADEKELIMKRLDYWSVVEPAWGSRTLSSVLLAEGFERVNRETIRLIRAEMGLETIYPKENTSKRAKNARKMPYLLRSLRAHDKIWLPNLVWAIDITYISMGRSHMYLVALIDWFSRFIVGWDLADTLETAPVLETVKKANKNWGLPAILNSDQGSQFTSKEYMAYLAENRVKQSMDGKGRWVDNVIIERWFRTLKINNIYINEYTNPHDLFLGIREFVERYNFIRPHQSLENKTPAAVYHGCFKC